MKLVDFTIIGRRYGRLVVEAFVKRTKHQHTVWRCRCDCGKVVEIERTTFVSGGQQSCGCFRREKFQQIQCKEHWKHRLSRTKEYRAWLGAKSRCYSPIRKDFKYYGGRGIKMCDQWRDDFEAFLAHIGPCPYGLTLDRINNDGNYEPGNVHWVTPKQQAANRRLQRNPVNGQFMGVPGDVDAVLRG